jgi:glutathione peroxidase-family protein
MLKRHMPDSEVKHNFYKYIIGRDGVPIAFYKKSDTLLDMESAIINELETI